MFCFNLIMFRKICNSAGLRCRLNRSTPAIDVWNARYHNTASISPILANNSVNVIIIKKKSNINSISSMMIKRYCSSSTTTDKVNKSDDDDLVAMKKMLIYGMNGISYDKQSILKLKKMFTDLVEEHKSTISAKVLAKMFYELKDISIDSPEKLEMLKLMIVQSKNCNEHLSAHVDTHYKAML